MKQDLMAAESAVQEKAVRGFTFPYLISILLVLGSNADSEADDLRSDAESLCTQETEGLPRLMTSENWLERQYGVRSTMDLSRECVSTLLPMIVKMFDDESAAVRREAVYSVGEIGLCDETILDGLYGLVTDANAQVRIEVIAAIGKLAHCSDRSVDNLAHFFESGDAMECALAKARLVEIGASSLPVFLRNVRNEVSSISDRARIALRELMPLSEVYLLGCIEYCNDEEEKTFLSELLDTLRDESQD